MGNQVDFRFALAKAYQASGNLEKAAALYRGIYLGDPLSPEATSAKTQMAAMNTPLSAAERKQHADAMFNAKQYTLAEEEYRALQKSGNDLSQSDRDALDIYAAVCDLRLKKLSSRRGGTPSRDGRRQRCAEDIPAIRTSAEHGRYGSSTMRLCNS